LGQNVNSNSITHSTVQMFGVSSSDAVKWLKVKVKTFTLLQPLSISNRCCYFEFYIHQ